jgi:N-methylhydantoinase A
VVERIDADGAIVRALDGAQARSTIADLARAGVESVGICLLWGHVNPEHEQRLAQLVRDELPGIDVSLSSELAPRLGEYERSVTVVLNAYVAPLLARYIHDLDLALRANGFRGTFLLTKNSGGVEPASRLAARPVETLNSGPVSGLVAASAIGRRNGHSSVVATDVGGTSFDVGLVIDGEPRLTLRPMIGRYDIATPVVDIVSVGTGGGSIAWLDPELGALGVGPGSAGADPGPACYGRGGVEPTVTDAAAVLGYIVKVGASELDVQAATKAVEGSIAEPLGVLVHQAAEGILEVASSQMVDLHDHHARLRPAPLRALRLRGRGAAVCRPLRPADRRQRRVRPPPRVGLLGLRRGVQ